VALVSTRKLSIQSVYNTCLYDRFAGKLTHMAIDASVGSAQETSNDFCVICTCLGMLLTTDKLHFRIFFGVFVAKKIMAIRRHSGLPPSNN